MNVIVGSASERKLDVVRSVFTQMVTNEEVVVTGYEARSGVSETPYGKETYDGALNRARQAKGSANDARYAVGIESGLAERYGHVYEEAWSVIISSDDKEFWGYSSGLRLPDYVAKHMDELDKEHWQVMPILREKHGQKPHSADTWATYSGGAILRRVSIEESLRNAIIQIFSPDHSFYKQSMRPNG